ncbi:MAG: hypothetical protein KIT34_08725 [Cyanobacteria bacterium TGS_CYA1]|nr:hypothetical protein [Cyanobacteria bacterium TGS_CYA1]
MKILPWFATLLNLLETGCAKSPILEDLARPELTVAVSQNICLWSWPLISVIPENVEKVRKLLPESMVYTAKFFDQVADKDKHFQTLNLKQCRFFGFDQEQLSSWDPDVKTSKLRNIFEAQCRSNDLKEGILAILTIELAATFFGRYSYQIVEKYFADPNHNSIDGRRFTEQELIEGLAWARYHAKPNARQALWIKGLSEELELDPPNKLPPSVIQLVDAIYQWWQSPLSVERELVKK